MASRWFTILSRVLLPEPLGPMMVTTSPRFTVMSMPRSTWFGPYALWTSVQTTKGSSLCSRVSRCCSARSSIQSLVSATCSLTVAGSGGEGSAGAWRAGAATGVSMPRKPKKRPSALALPMPGSGSFSRLKRRSRIACTIEMALVITR